MVYSNAKAKPVLLQRPVKTIYSHLISRHTSTLIAVRRMPHIQFESTWRNMYKSPLSAGPRDVCWRICHSVIPIRGFLVRFQRMRSDRRPLCAMDVEYVSHLSHSCIKIQGLWCIVNTWLSAITRSTVNLSIQQALFF